MLVKIMVRTLLHCYMRLAFLLAACRIFLGRRLLRCSTRLSTVALWIAPEIVEVSK